MANELRDKGIAIANQAVEADNAQRYDEAIKGLSERGPEGRFAGFGEASRPTEALLLAPRPLRRAASGWVRTATRGS